MTHTLLGAVSGHAAFSRRLGPKAAGIGAVAGVLADGDVVIRKAADPLFAIEYHRHFTHSLAFAVLASLLVAAVWFLQPRYREQWKPLWACSFLAYATHCLLDASTSYGSQLMWPFTSHRFGWHLVSIIDPVFTLALVGGLLAALIWKKERATLAAFVFCLAYLAFGGLQHWRAEDALARLTRQRGHESVRLVAMPTLGNNIVWRALYEHDGRIYSDRIRVGWFSSATFRQGTSMPLMRPEELTADERERNRSTKAFERFLWFSDNWVARAPSDPAVIGDMRYSLSSDAFDPIWGIRFVEDTGAENSIVWVDRSRNRKLSVSELWNEITGAHAGYSGIGQK